MATPFRLSGIQEQHVLDELQLHWIQDPQEQRRWNQRVIAEHYLHNATLVGEQLRYAASYQGQWLALIGWSAPAWHLAAREAWLKWTEAQRRGRLHFLAQNSRFAILADRQQLPNLGTRAMKLNLDRLAEDWQAQYGHPILAVESFVDGQLFRGTLYKASNWTLLGPTAGFGRVAEDFYVAHERPKELWVRGLHPQAREWLAGDSLPEGLQPFEKAPSPRCQLGSEALGSLRERFAVVTEFRKGQGKRHKIPTVLAIAACAKMSGVIGGYSGIASYAKNLRRPQRRALHCWINEKTGEYEVPSESCIQRVLKGVSALEVESITLAWQDAVLGPNTDPLVAIDGKTVRHSGVHLAGAISLPSHRCLGVEPVADKSNEIPAVQRLLERAPIVPGQMVSLDAMHTQHKTVGQILYDKGADYLVPIKGNQDGLLETARQLLPESVPPSGGED
jgi:predicted transposase YbfD/YdcC